MSTSVLLVARAFGDPQALGDDLVDCLARGFSAPVGSWNTIWTAVVEDSLHRPPVPPAERFAVEFEGARVGLCRPWIALIRVVFPEPDSPTRASTSPGSTCSDAPSTARDLPKWTWRSSISTSGVTPGCMRRSAPVRPAETRVRRHGTHLAPPGTGGETGTRRAVRPGSEGHRRGRPAPGGTPDRQWWETLPQAPRVGVGRVFEHVPARALFDDAPCVHDGEALTRIRQDGRVVGDEQHRQRAPASARRGAPAPGPAP